MIQHRRTPRFYIRLCCLVLTILLVCPFPFWIYHSSILVQASPFVTICTILAGGTLGLGSILGIGFSIAAMVRKRLFCRNICPVGLTLDAVSNIGLRRNVWWKNSPGIGKCIALITAAGAITGYPLLLWIDPLVFLNSAFSVYTATTFLSVVISISGLTLLLLIALTSGSLWCSRICPLGATQDFLGNIGSFLISFKDSQKEKSQKSGLENSFPVTRRMLLIITAGIGLGLFAKRIGIAHNKNTLLRPPGAIDEVEFAGQCVRCGNCVRVCPSKIIHPDPGHAGILGLLAPVVSYEKGYCIETCNDCTRVCPSGALKKLNLEKKQKYIIGKAVFNPSLCFLVRGVNDCDICVRSCPFDAVHIYWDEDLYVAYPVVDLLKCNGCGACELFCPTGDVKAIRVWNRGIL